MTIEYDYDIPVPGRRSRNGVGPSVYDVLRGMPVGASKLFPLDGKSSLQRQKVLSASGRTVAQRDKSGAKFATRIAEGGVRVWRIA